MIRKIFIEINLRYKLFHFDKANIRITPKACAGKEEGSASNPPGDAVQYPRQPVPHSHLGRAGLTGDARQRRAQSDGRVTSRRLERVANHHVLPRYRLHGVASLTVLPRYRSGMPTIKYFPGTNKLHAHHGVGQRLIL